MKLSTKIFAVFSIALIVNICIIFFGLTSVLDNLSTMLMKKQAEDLAEFLELRIGEVSKSESDKKIAEIIPIDFLAAKHVAEESKSFELRKILLIRDNYDVQVGYPDSESGKSYAEHKDIRDAFVNKKMQTVVETITGPDGKTETDIDVVSYFTLEDGSPRVLEVKLDFAKSITLLEAQYAYIEIAAIVIAMLILVGLLGILLFIMRRTAVKPVLRVTHAMEKVGTGDLDIRLNEDSRDEFGMLARRFNEMVAGLKEKLHLYKYVSQGTIDAVRDKVSHSIDDHVSERRDLVIFFSDIRSFTTFSETHDPQEIVAVLNRILSIQSEIIKKHGGDIDKFVGDEVMAVFNDPSSAIRASLDIQKEIAARNSEVDMLQLGIGIHRGVVVQGDIGSEDQKDFTVIGDSVNTAARLQAAAKSGEVLISEDIASDADVKTSFAMTLKGGLKLKGKEIIIKTYNVTGEL
jgi:class 3 adenylate cyclase